MHALVQKPILRYTNVNLRTTMRMFALERLTTGCAGDPCSTSQYAPHTTTYNAQIVWRGERKGGKKTQKTNANPCAVLVLLRQKIMCRIVRTVYDGTLDDNAQ